MCIFKTKFRTLCFALMHRISFHTDSYFQGEFGAFFRTKIRSLLNEIRPESFLVFLAFLGFLAVFFTAFFQYIRRGKKSIFSPIPIDSSRSETPRYEVSQTRFFHFGLRKYCTPTSEWSKIGPTPQLRVVVKLSIPNRSSPNLTKY